MHLKCTYCDDETICPCPEGSFDAHKDAKHACDVCMELMDQGVSGQELKNHPKRAELKVMHENFEISGLLSEIVADQNFEKDWAESKSFLKTLSKKELSQEVYCRGVQDGIRFMLESERTNQKDVIIKEVKKGIKELSFVSKT